MPSDPNTRKEWISAIENANKERFRAIGSICQLHFETEQFRKTKNNNQCLQLKKGEIPTIFPSDTLIDIIEVDDNFDPELPEKTCESCEELKYMMFKAETDHELLKTNFEIKLKKLIESNKDKSALIVSLKAKISQMVREKTTLETKYSSLVNAVGQSSSKDIGKV